MNKALPTARHTVKHYLDNKSVISRINKAWKASWTSPNQRLQSEQDVIDAIIHLLHLLPVEINFCWIKGHQDSITAYEKLTLPAQLNCDADREATTYMNTTVVHKHINTPLPGTPSQLIIHNKSITGRYKRRIREATAIPKLHAYLKQKFIWDDNTLHSIDWTMFEQILHHYKDKWTTIVKHLHAISPTGHIAHRNDPHLPHECPACSSPLEDNTHVITCSHASRLPWRQTTIHKITHYARAKSDPILLDILRDGLTRFHRTLPLLSPADYPPRYSQLIVSQNSIGWDQLYRGRWSIQWTMQQDQYLERKQDGQDPRQGPSAWLIGLGRLLIDQWLQLWQLRNEQRHGKDATRFGQVQEQAIHSRLQELYKYRLEVCPEDKHIFHSSPEEHLAQHNNLDAIENWILTYKDAILASAGLAQKLGISRNRTLHEYPAFNPITQVGL